jgi:hypothetical protein
MPVGVGQPQVAAGELIEKIGHADFSFFRRRLYGAREARIGLPSRREAGIAAAHDQDEASEASLLNFAEAAEQHAEVPLSVHDSK